MRALVILAAIALIGVVVWFVFAGEEPAPPEAIAPAAEETPQAETESESAVDEAIEQTEDALEAATDEATTAVEELQEQATEAIDNAEDRVNQAIEGALENVNEAVDDASNAASDALEPEEVQGETTGSLAEALTVEGFDPTTLRQAIADSDLGVVQTQLADGLVAQAEENPDLIQGVIEQLRELLGPE